MFGNLINVAAIIIGSIIGIILKKGIPERFQNIITACLGLSIMSLGIKDAMTMKNGLFIVGCVLIGSVFGEMLKIQDKTTRFGEFLQKKFTKEDGSDIVKGFVITTLMFLVGAMAIVGPMKSGLMGDHSILLVKSLLDGTFAIIFATKYGIGITFSAIPVFLYQGAMWLLSYLIKDALDPAVVGDITAIGGILMLGIGINQVFDRNLKLLNMVPAIFIPIIVKISEPLWIPILSFFK